MCKQPETEIDIFKIEIDTDRDEEKYLSTTSDREKEKKLRINKKTKTGKIIFYEKKVSIYIDRLYDKTVILYTISQQNISFFTGTIESDII